jgi:hypothetical protein
MLKNKIILNKKIMIINIFCYIKNKKDKKLDEMSMRKFEKIKDNILMIHKKDGKKIEKELVDLPGPATYNPSYNLLEDKGYMVQ